MAIFDGNLKQRLIGALVLIVLAIVFLPMILNNKGEDQTDTVVTIPEAPTQPAATINQVSQNTPQVPETPPVTTQPQVSSNTTTQETATQTENTQPITSTSTPNTNEIAPSWTIQVASGSIQANAESLTNRLRKANYNAYIRLDGKIYRIFVGPFVQKYEAERVRNLIKKQFKEEGIVRDFKPESN